MSATMQTPAVPRAIRDAKRHAAYDSMSAAHALVPERYDSAPLLAYLEECRQLVIAEIQRIVPDDPRYGSVLYDLIMDYPLREAKGLRPSLCIATCRALGGRLESVLRSAAVFELYHNAFLIHDDIEDESEMRRGDETLHRKHGVPIAINVGDAMLSLTLRPLLDNVETVGLGASLRILRVVARMVSESVEGQALELGWIRDGRWDLDDADYVRMVEQKTGWYSFIAPVMVGAISAGARGEVVDGLSGFARSLGIAFQIQDDVLNLRADAQAYGKEIGGDLWEGKRTLILLHALRHATAAERFEAKRVLALPRGDAGLSADVVSAAATPLDKMTVLLEGLVTSGELSAAGRGAIQAQLERAFVVPSKTAADAAFLAELIARYGSIEYAEGVARTWLSTARSQLEACEGWLPRSIHHEMLTSLVEYVHTRSR